MKKIELTDQEVSIIQNALNAHWIEARTKLDEGYEHMFDGTKRPLGDLEKAMYEKQVIHSLPLVRRFEHL